MKKALLAYFLLLTVLVSFSQTKPNPKEKSMPDMDKAMEDAMKGMSEEDKTEMRKMMKTVMPDMEKKPASAVVPFSDNKKLIPVKDVSRIKNISRKILTDAELSADASMLYNKLIAKIRPEEKAIISGVSSKAKSGSALMDGSLTSFLQGHSQAAMGLAMKAVQVDPKNVNYQNNLAAILSQSGYPEKAIPYLKKLSKQFPTNGTVVHNLAYAWLGLGEIDTARRLFAYAAVNNPSNPETMLCRGLIEELRGDPKKAIDHYVESFEHAPNPFAENLAKNVRAEGRLEKIDFDKLKGRMAIHDYFKKDWIKIPVLGDNVSAFESNMRIKNGFQNMIEKLNNNIDAMIQASSVEMQAAAENDSSGFIGSMMDETRKGLSVMSMPAVYIQKILQEYMHVWNQRYMAEYDSLMKSISAKQEVMTKTRSKDKCPDFDKQNNEFMAYANPLIRVFHTKKIEEFRVWLNAFCTWTWYIAGNPKNVVLTQCLGWTSFITQMYQHAVNDQYAIQKSCVKQDGDGVVEMQVPDVPNFTCPTVVSFPVGMNALRLSAETINFDDNAYHIKQSEAMHIPNVTMSFGIDKEHISEPGKYGNPYVKSGNGSMNTSGITDEELTPLSKILDALTPLSKSLLDELAPHDPTIQTSKKLGVNDFEKMTTAEVAQKILAEMMHTECPGQPERKATFEVGFGEIEWLDEEPAESNGKVTFEVSIGEIVFEDTKPVKTQHKEKFKVGIGEIEFEDVWDEEMQAYINMKGEKRYKEGFKEKLINDVREALTTSGFQTVISNGLEGIRNLSSSERGLFEK